MSNHYDIQEHGMSSIQISSFGPGMGFGFVALPKFGPAGVKPPVAILYSVKGSQMGTEGTTLPVYAELLPDVVPVAAHCIGAYVEEARYFFC